MQGVPKIPFKDFLVKNEGFSPKLFSSFKISCISTFMNKQVLLGQAEVILN